MDGLFTPTFRIIQGIQCSSPEAGFALAWEADTENKKHNKPSRDNHYQPFSFDAFP
jgi:hypothetical protein